MKIAKVLLANHFFFTNSGPIHGPANVVSEYLRKNREQYILLNYPLIYGKRPFYERYRKGRIFFSDFGINIKLSLPLKSFFEILNSTVVGVIFRPDIYIGIDPLNALAGIFLRRLGFVKKTIFYSVDYTPIRFENAVLNSFYQRIDRFCAMFSDEVWNVSTRIVELRRVQGINEDKIKFLPNSPNFNDCPRLPTSKIDKNKIVMVTGLTHSPVFPLVLKSFRKVSQKHPRLFMNVIGTGEYENDLKEMIKDMGLSSKIKFLGQLNNKDVLREVASSRLGLALYAFSKKFSWIYYGDSKKTREYLACGVPVVISDVVATSEDVGRYNAGVVVKLDSNEISFAIRRIMVNNNLWLRYRRGAIALAKDYDFEKKLDSLLKV